MSRLPMRRMYVMRGSSVWNSIDVPLDLIIFFMLPPTVLM